MYGGHQGQTLQNKQLLNVSGNSLLPVWLHLVLIHLSKMFFSQHLAFSLTLNLCLHLFQQL